MTSYTDGSSAGYIGQAYGEAARQLEDFQRDGDVDHLLKAIDRLCGALGQMRDDTALWEQIGSALSDAQEMREQIAAKLRDDVDDFLGVEFSALVSAGMNEADARRLVSELTRYLDYFTGDRDFRDLLSLQAAIGNLQMVTCDGGVRSALESGREQKGGAKPPRHFVRGVRIVLKVLTVVGGVAVAVANIVVLAGADGGTSVVLGLEAAWRNALDLMELRLDSPGGG